VFKLKPQFKKQIIWVLVCFLVPFSILALFAYYITRLAYDECLSMKLPNCSVAIDWNGYFGFIMGGSFLISSLMAILIPNILPNRITHFEKDDAH